MDGLTRANALSYLWSSRLLRPDGRVSLVYLDLNHWISLARAATGHPDGRLFHDALALLRELCSAGRVVCPLSSTHYMEKSGIGDERRRFDVAAVMEELSDFRCLSPRDTLMEIEFEAALDELGHPSPQPHDSVELLGRGVLRAFGLRGCVRIRDRNGGGCDRPGAPRVAGGSEAFDAWTADAERLLDRSLLRGQPPRRNRRCGNSAGIRRPRDGLPSAAPSRSAPRWRGSTLIPSSGGNVFAT